MARLLAVTAALVLTSAAAATQSLLPRCTPALDGVVSAGGCACGYDPGGQLAVRAPGWRWRCDVLRGPGAEASVPSVGDAAPAWPSGLHEAPAGNAAAY